MQQLPARETPAAQAPVHAPFPFQLAAIDIDGTLAADDGSISALNRAVIAFLVQQGVQVVLASGRSHANMLPFYHELSLTGPVVSSQGALVRDSATGDILYQQTMAPPLVETLTRQGRDHQVSIVQYRRDGIYVEARTRFTDYDQSRNAEPQVLVPDLLADPAAAVDKMIWLADSAIVTALTPKMAALLDGTATVTHTDPEYLEFSAPGINKAIGVGALAAHLRIPPSAVLAFGDGNNDAALLSWAGLGVAVGHATHAAKAAADLVGPPSDPGDALARAFDLVWPDWTGAAAASV